MITYSLPSPLPRESLTNGFLHRRRRFSWSLLPCSEVNKPVGQLQSDFSWFATARVEIRTFPDGYRDGCHPQYAAQSDTEEHSVRFVEALGQIHVKEAEDFVDFDPGLFQGTHDVTSGNSFYVFVSSASKCTTKFGHKLPEQKSSKIEPCRKEKISPP